MPEAGALIVHQLSELEQVTTLAVIINVNTKLVTTLALMSALRYVPAPILLLDCESKDGSFEHFKALQAAHRFLLMPAPRRPHGYALDWIFNQAPAENILLIDSDVEILGAELPARMCAEIASDDVDGCGFVHDGAWMTGLNAPCGWYVERFWIPFLALKAATVRQGLAAGLSFIDQRVPNDFPPWERLSRVLMYRYRAPGLGRLRLGFLDSWRREYFGHKPSFLYYDTGAVLYQSLFKAGQARFSSLPWALNEQGLIHFHGVSRRRLNWFDYNSTRVSDIRRYVSGRLRTEYGVAG